MIENIPTRGTYIIYGWSWKCTNKECGEITTLLFCDNFSPIQCPKCGSLVNDTPYKDAFRIAKELCNKYGAPMTDVQIQKRIKEMSVTNS